jgi:hypothetical protein
LFESGAAAHEAGYEQEKNADSEQKDDIQHVEALPLSVNFSE